MITIEERNLFGQWEAVSGKTFDTVAAARAWCIEMSDVLGIAYRILQDGQPVDQVDLEAGFFALQADQDADRASAEESGIPDYDDMGMLRGYKPPSDPADL